MRSQNVNHEQILASRQTHLPVSFGQTLVAVKATATGFGNCKLSSRCESSDARILFVTVLILRYDESVRPTLKQ